MNYVLNGSLCEGDLIPVSIQAEGLNYGLGVFETVKIVEEKPCFLTEHFDRIYKSAQALGLEFSVAISDLEKQIQGLCTVNGLSEGAVKVLCFESLGKSNVLVCERSVTVTSHEPLLLSVSNAVRSSTSLTVNHKTLNYAENIVAMRNAQSHGFDDCIFLNENGFITESSIANLFFVSDGKLKTPSLKCGLLNGVIRGQVLGIAEELGYLVEEGSYRIDDLEEAEAAFLTNSLKGVVPIRRIEFQSKAFDFEKLPVVARLSERLSEVELKSL
ncbi:aminotransferase class IV [Puniceicoccaceae bacterium K14]|nr:aminotransferase class IV [Puniceicoccaceae bacterium K14]